MVKDAQVRKLMDEMSKHGHIGTAGLRAGMHRNTARRYVEADRLPSQLKGPRTWRTREDPFAEDWEEVASSLEQAPELEAKTLFEDLLRRRPGRYGEGQLRSFQRRVKQWRAEHGPAREIFLPQQHRPGEAMQTDFTRASSLGVRIGGERFEHLLCHSVLPYSNWESVVVCRSESMLALRRGVQAAVLRLGRVAEWHQTDNSTAATHDLRTGKRGFNAEYEELMRQLGMKPRTIAIGACHQNGDVEAANGALKRRLEQHLLLRGSRGFATVEEYESWIGTVIEQANGRRSARLSEEMAVLRPLTGARLPGYRELHVRVSSNSTIQVQRNTYSVPPRLKGERLVVRLSDLELEVYYGGRRQLVIERLRGEGKHRIDYRHVIWSLVKKPWALARYRYREALFPTPVFRRAYDVLVEALAERRGELEYLRVLHLAAASFEHEVASAVEQLLGQGHLPTFAEVRALAPERKPAVPELTPLVVDLASYDELLVVGAER
ncbi:MAG TPA: IS21 family transposase [Burkholderiales bacterium]|nr:IS21 family transposase [Burkholderiales bacterium]